ncbi:MAG: hypothetical protein J6I96_03900 [Oscillospiraceae bacterium]|nr:hypothetical protein [Oscillospiraceae bacterium]
MIRKFLDKIAGREKKFSVAGTAAVCAMSALTCSFWQFEFYMPMKVMDFLIHLAVIVMILLWAYASFANGLLKRVSFAVFTAAYWVVPLLIADYSDSVTDPRKFNVIVYMAGEYSKLLGIDALFATPLGKLSPVAAAVIFSTGCLILFLIGMFIGTSDKGQPQEQEKEEEPPVKPRAEEAPVFAEPVEK